MTSKELREKYIKFFLEKGHQEIPSASLVPENDPTVLFTTAGMHPLVPYLLGELHPEGKRLVNVQKCVRTGDIDDVGDSTHNTFFEMLGNWSLGDYFKDDSIRWSWEFLTNKKWLGISPDRIKVTVFEGDEDAPRDEESIKVWQECFEKIGINAEIFDKEKKNNEDARIFPLPKEDNWWGPAGYEGACGSDTEIFIDLKKSVNFENCPNDDDCKPGCHCGRYVEIWNNVFMDKKGLRTVKLKEKSTGKIIELPKKEYNFFENEKKEEYEFLGSNVKILESLPKKNVDTGMGLERTLAILNEYNNVYETDVLAPIIEKIEEFLSSGTNYKDNPKTFRIIADHIRTSVFMISDGVIPSNLERGYILRRLIRRAIRHARIVGITELHFTFLVAKEVIEIYKDVYPELEKNKDFIQDCLVKEESKFCRTLEKGLKELEKLELIGKMQKVKSGEKMKVFNRVDAKKAFYIFQTFGFPLEMIQEELAKKILIVDEEEFNEEFKKHQQLSRTASAGKFKGGLADASEETTRLHTVAHLLLESLRRVLGEHVFQKGSNITAERLRFDYSHSEKLTDEEKQKVEEMVNEQIQKKLPVNCEEMSLEKTKEIGAMGVFENKYGEKVKVYTIGESDNVFSREICGGPHIKNTRELGKFMIKKEQSSSAGVRRIKAVLK